jgi:hypothetical protein
LPEDWQVHHILPIEYGGTHDFDNLVLVRWERHESIHNEIKEQIRERAIDVNEEFEINLPDFAGFKVYPG